MQNIKRGPWSDEEHQRLVKLAGTMKPEQIAVELGRTWSAVRNRARVCGISVSTSEKKRRNWTQEEEQFLIANNDTMTIKQMAEALDRSYFSVHERGRRLKLDMRSYGEKNHLTSYSNDDVRLCRELFKEGLSRQVIAEKMEVPYACVCAWVNGRRRVKECEK